MVRTFHLFNRYMFTLLTKMWTGTKTVPSTWYIFNVQGCIHTDFHWRSVTFVTGHLFTFLVVLSLVCLVTTQILICENQTIWRLEILLRTIVTALLKTKDISVTPVVIIALSWLTTESEACDKIFQFQTEKKNRNVTLWLFKSTECKNVWYLDKIFLEPKAFEPSSWWNSVEPSFFAFFFQPVSDHSNYVSAWIDSYFGASFEFVIIHSCYLCRIIQRFR